MMAILPAGTSPEAVAAVFGREDRPRDGWWDAYEIFKKEIKKERLAKKSPGQLRRWENSRKGAISHFLSLVGDKPIVETTREDGLTLRRYWLERVVPDDRKRRRCSPNTANKEIGVLRDIYSAYFKRLQGDDGRTHSPI